MVIMHVWFIGLKGHSGEIAGVNNIRLLFLLIGFFLFSRNSRERFWGSVLWYFWIERARHLGPTSLPRHVGVEFLNVGGWLTHGDFALEVGVDFLAVAERRLIPARVRSEWSRLRGKGLSSVWAPASQDSSHVSNAGVGVVSMRCAPLALPTFATAQFKRFFDCRRAVGCMLPLGLGRFMHLVVLYGYQGADVDAEQLALTEQLSDAPFGELSVVAMGQPSLLVGVFNVEPTKIPCLAKGVSAGLWVDLEGAWLLVCNRLPHVSVIRVLVVVIGETLWLVALLLMLLFFPVGFRLIGGLLLILRFGLFLTAAGGLVRLLSLCNVLPFGLLLGCLLLIRRGSKSVEVQRVWEVYDERLQFMSRQDALQLDESLGAGYVSRAWLLLSGAAEAALADAYQFSGGPLPGRGLVLGRGSASFRVVRLGGHRVRKARGHAADVFLYRDSSVAPLLDMRRRFKAVMDVLDAMIRYGVSLSRSVELTAQWDRILAAGPFVSCQSC